MIKQDDRKPILKKFKVVTWLKIEHEIETYTQGEANHLACVQVYERTDLPPDLILHKSETSSA